MSASNSSNEPQSYTSQYLLTDAEVLQKGLSTHNVESYRRFYYTKSFGILTWYESLKEHTFKTVCTPLKFDEAQRILKRGFGQQDNSEEDQLNELSSLESRIDELLSQNFPNGAFVKLDTRSPKDVVIYDYKNEGIQQAIDEQLKILPSDSLEDFNSQVTAFVKATNISMKINSGRDAIRFLLKSHRIHADLSKASEFGENLFFATIVLREWIPDISLRPDAEFRGFVHKKQLNALTQYFSFLHFPYLVSHKQEIGDRIYRFHESIKHLIPHDNYVIDFSILDDRIYVIELNPFHIGAGAGLFSWKTDRELFMNGPFEIRVTTKSMQIENKELDDILPNFWKKYIDDKVKELKRPILLRRYFTGALVVALVSIGFLYLYRR
eukprot:TRINITY_DN5433_c0_g2_i4.p1 TRINITY_DN5433_c0_g2~~TRINITY_DN5433_c0_g2_i4.p1  ORF type:complete len:381 (+),score=68.64 TRINITY_DN5433_c0_g2_i4:894-2036(+)